jgi:hypothetical protein
MAGSDQWYYCLEHGQVEQAGEGCALDRAMGPYPSAAAAAEWRKTSEARNAAWDEDDRRWDEGE